jgi:hypothetical protein
VRSYEPLLNATGHALGEMMRDGYSIDPERLCDTVYHGISLGLPRWVERLSWKKFMKVFYLDPKTDSVRGWNVRAVDNGLEEAWIPKIKGGAQLTFGHFDVYSPSKYAVHPHELILDYGRRGHKGNGLLNALRDPIIALTPDSTDLLLGWSYLAIGGRRVRTPSYFLLIRGSPLTELIPTPL